MSSSPPPPDNRLLQIAWQRQQAYDKNASRYQKRFVTLRTWLAILSIAVVILSVIENPNSAASMDQFWEETLNISLLLLPITITGLLGFSVRFDRGQSWILLRGNAEALKMEIYYYRTCIGAYAENRDIVLAKRIKQISEGVKGGPVHQGALFPYEEEPQVQPLYGLIIRFLIQIHTLIFKLIQNIWKALFQISQKSLETSIPDDRYSDLTDPEKYLNYRLENQFNWYRNKATRLARQLQICQSGIYLFGGIGTLLGALEPVRSWVAVTTALTGAATNFLEFKRIEASLVGYNQAADALYDIRAWWYSLSAAERKSPKNFRKLVLSCEETIRSEHSSWLQDMQDRLSQLYGAGEDDTSEDQASPQPKETR